MTESRLPRASAAEIRAGLAAVHDRIERAGGDLSRITVVAVAKTLPAATVVAAAEAGITDVGENYAQELVAKAAAAPSVRWHFIGPVQRNKVKALAPLVHLWHTLDRPALAEELAVRAPGAAVLVQVAATGEPTKHGAAPDDVGQLVELARSLGLDVRGLMAIGPQGPPEAARPVFRAVADLGRRLHLPELSMGMSGDLEVAVQEGATIVRVGTSVFGPRPVHGEVRR